MKIILITGGQRSGKSVYAERLALSLSANPVYIATAHIYDDEFRERVRIHQERRGLQWTNIEEEQRLSRHNVSSRVVLVDCCTLWLTNFMYAEEREREPQEAFEDIKAEFDRLTSQNATFIFVTNEIGLGGISANAVQRHFADALGWFNQYVASKADEVILMVSGIGIKIK